jgi:hypothetical protein
MGKTNGKGEIGETMILADLQHQDHASPSRSDTTGPST